MMLMFMVMLISTILPAILLFVVMMLSTRTLGDREKSSPFECGFDPNHMARIPFSTRFFLLAIIFIVFDIEIVLLMPLPMILQQPSTLNLAASMIFLLILLLGLLHEWNQGSLNWAK